MIVDATFGAGGYTRRLLDAGATVHAFDRDPDAIAAGRDWPETRRDPPRLVLHPRRFSEMVAALAEAGDRAGRRRRDGYRRLARCSSTRPERGFAFAADGPLDMRMSAGGPERRRFRQRAPTRARSPTCCSAMARSASRAGSPARSSPRGRCRPPASWPRVVRKALGYRPGAPKDPATRSFQAIRIHVNGELDELDAGPGRAPRRCSAPAAGWRWSASTAWRTASSSSSCARRAARGRAASRHLPRAPRRRRADLRAGRQGRSALARPRLPRNPRARSATLRAATRTDAPAARKEGRMNLTRDRIRSIGWAVGARRLRSRCMLALTFRVNAVQEPGAPGRAADRRAQAGEDAPRDRVRDARQPAAAARAGTRSSSAMSRPSAGQYHRERAPAGGAGQARRARRARPDPRRQRADGTATRGVPDDGLAADRQADRRATMPAERPRRQSRRPRRPAGASGSRRRRAAPSAAAMKATTSR